MMIGYDKLAINHQLLLHLTFEEMTGLLAYDRAKPAHPHTLRGGIPTWNSLANGLPYLDFNAANPDWLDCGAVATADLNFIAGDFSWAFWINADAIGSSMIMMRGSEAVDGWQIQMGRINPGDICLLTNQAGAGQTSRSPAGTVVVATWCLIGVTRLAASVRILKNGMDVTEIADTHINPVTCNRELHIGIDNDEINTPLDGQIAGGPCGPRGWGRGLAEWEHLEIFNMERHWFGV